MCLAVPARVLQRDGDDAVVDLGGVQRSTSLMLLPDAVVGDWVLIHAGYAIECIDEERAQETLKILSEYFQDEMAGVVPPPGSSTS